MKIFVFILGLSFASFSFAEVADQMEHPENLKEKHKPHTAESTSAPIKLDGKSGHDDSAKNANNETVCAPGEKSDKKCDDHGGHKKSHGKNKDWTHQRLEQVAGVMPQPTQDSTRRQTPQMVSLSSPKSLSTIQGNEVKLEWSPSQNAKVYHVQVSKDAGFNNRSMYVFNNYNVTDTSIQVTGLEANTKYFWRVAAVNNEMRDSFTKSNFTSSTFSTK